LSLSAAAHFLLLVANPIGGLAHSVLNTTL
jgi:hypothetical protein